MITSTTRFLRHPTLAIAIGFTALSIAACNGTNSTSSNAGALPATARLPRGATKPLPTPYQWTFSTENDPNSPTFTRVTGIDDLEKITGYYGAGTSSDPSHGFSARAPYTKFRRLDYPSALDTSITSTATDIIYAGYFLDNSGQHTWGFIINKGIWGQYKDDEAPKGPGSVTEFLGVNANAMAVGYYVNSYGIDEPFEFAANKFHPLNPPGYITATANGINLTGIIAGTETLSNGTTQGWLLHSQNYYTFAYPDSTDTQVNSLNYQQQVVGSYVDYAGVTHGFILTNPTSSSNQYWQSVDEPNAAGTTVITAINNHHSISGWYVDSNGNTNGFVGILIKTNARR